MPHAFSLVPDTASHDAEAELLYDRAFGPGRHAKAAGRLREGNVCQRSVSFLAIASEALVGACRLWPIESSLGGKALFLGPIAVEASMRGAGLGHALVEACIKAVDQSSGEPVVLVGDMSFFASFGFVVVPDGQITMPGPVDPSRMLWRLGAAADKAGLPKGLLRVPR